MSFAPGTRLGPYEILSQLGAGGMGEVYLAKDPRLGREVAIKVLPADLAGDAASLRRLEREARTIAAISHPNILAIHEFASENGVVFAVTELLKGETLRQRLDRDPLSARRAAEIARGIALGLAAAHEKGIVHRDLKPENLFLTRDGAVKILDFGLARPSAERQSSGGSTYTEPSEVGRVVGTAGYMSPEQVRGQPVDHRSDIFSFGCVLYEMLSGRRAFAASSAADAKAAILKEEPPETVPTDPVLSSPLERIVRHCLEKNPDHRFQSASDLAFDLAGLSGSSAGASAAQGHHLRRWARSAALAAAAAALLAVGIFGARHRGPVAPASFVQKTFQDQEIFNARYAPDQKTIVFSAAPYGKIPELYVIRPEYPDPRPLGLAHTHLLSVSSKGELAVLTNARLAGIRVFLGTLARVPLGSDRPREIMEEVCEADWAPDGENLAIIRFADGQYRLEYPVGKVLYQSEDYLSDLRVSPGGDRVAFFAHPHPWFDDSGTVCIVDRTAHVSKLGDFFSLEGLSWSPDGTRIFFSATNHGNLYRIFSASPGEEPREAFTSAGPLVVFDAAKDGRLLAMHWDTRILVNARAPGESEERDLSWLTNSAQPIISPDGRAIAFSNQSEPAGPNYDVMLRGTDGSSPSRIGDGFPVQLSRDGKWVLSYVDSNPRRFWMYPRGPGQAQAIGGEGFEKVNAASLFPDARSAIVCAHEPAKDFRCYVQDLSGSSRRPVTPDGYEAAWLRPDGRAAVLQQTEFRGYALLDLGTPSEPRSLSLGEGQTFAGWSGDGTSLFFARLDELPVPVERYDLATGKRSDFVRLMPRQLRGVIGLLSVSFAEDSYSYAYQYERSLGVLYEVEPAR